MALENKNLIVSFVVGLAVMWIIWSISSAVSPKTVSFPPAMMEAKANAARVAALKNSTNRPGLERAMPWNVAVNFIAKGRVTKIQAASGNDITLTMQGGVNFVTTQPTKDAYVAIAKKSTTPIEIVK